MSRRSGVCFWMKSLRPVSYTHLDVYKRQDLKDGMLRVQLTQKDFTTKQIEITVTDGAGNTSEKYVLQNPYYEWAKKQAEKQKTSGESNGAMATTTSADATGTEKTTIGKVVLHQLSHSRIYEIVL